MICIKKFEKLVEDNMDLINKAISDFQKKIEETKLSWQKEISPKLLLNPEFQLFLQGQRKKSEFQLNADELQDCYLVFVESLIRHQNKERFLMRSYTREKIVRKLENIYKQHENESMNYRMEKVNYQLWLNDCQDANWKTEQQTELQRLVEIFIENSNLTERQQEIIIRLFGLRDVEPQSREELMLAFNTTKQTIDYEKHRALQKMKLKRNYLDEKTF